MCSTFMKLKMIINIFIIFDPSTSINLSINWFSLIIMFFLLPMGFWSQSSRLTVSYYILVNYLFKEFKVLITYSFSNLIIFISLFLIILFNNFIGLFPYIFTSSSHVRFCLFLSASLWVGTITYRILNFFNDLCIHLTPKGTPPILLPFIVIIESISLLIRPVTLSIRLTANIVAGHLLLSLLGSSGQNLFRILIPLLIFIEVLLFILEISVSVIQAYVFTILCTLYRAEP